MSKVVICGAGFLGSHISRALTTKVPGAVNHSIQISSRRPEKIHASLKKLVPENLLLPPMSVDVTKPETLRPAFEDASTIVSLVGVMHGRPKDFEDIQWKGARNVAEAARAAGAKLLHISAIGADETSPIPYTRTKGQGELSVMEQCPNATIIRPSIVFGPEDDFFNRFSKLSKFLPFLPVFGGGTSRFQPVYVGDIAKAVEVIARDDPSINAMVSGKIIEAGGPDVFTYKEIMELVLKYNGRHRPIVSLPFWVGMIQSTILEKLPPNLFTVTRSQVEQLKADNIINPFPPNPERYFPFNSLIEKYPTGSLTSVHEILPKYLSQ